MAPLTWRGYARVASAAVGLALWVLTASCSGVATPPPYRDTMAECLAPGDGGNTFANNVYMLSSPVFDFTNNGGTSLNPPNYNPPNYTKTPVVEPYHSAMAAAFAIAPQRLQTALCNLALNQQTGIPTGVFIDPDDQAPFAWSFWEVPAHDAVPQQGTGKGRYIAVSTKLWQREHGLTLDGLEELILDQLLGANARGKGVVSSVYNGVTVTPADTTNSSSPSKLALMEILAREVGLIVYHDDVAAPFADVSPPSVCSTSSGRAVTFQSFSWKPPGYSLVTLGHIQSLGEETNPTNMKTMNRYPLPSSLRSSSNQYPPANPGSIASEVAAIYKGGDLPDLAADTTPYDDFAETFRLSMLMPTAQVPTGLISHMTIQLNGVSPEPDVMNNLANYPTIQLKVGCINKLNWAVP